MKYPKYVYTRRAKRRIVTKRERQEAKRLMAVQVSRYYAGLPSY
jgi:hypothetical protein